MAETKTATAQEILAELQAVTESLHARPCVRVSSGCKPCFATENERLQALTRRQREKASVGGFLRRDVARMCDECGAYEYLLRAIEKVQYVADVERIDAERSAT